MPLTSGPGKQRRGETLRAVYSFYQHYMPQNWQKIPEGGLMSNWVVVVKCGTGGLSGETEKEKGELVIPMEAGELKAGEGNSLLGAMAAPGFGNLKLVKTAWGIPGAPADPPPNWGKDALRILMARVFREGLLRGWLGDRSALLFNRQARNKA